MVTFTAEQEQALARVRQWLKSGKSSDWSFILTGPAGTGKSTLAEALDKPNTIFCSPTGKGAQALRQRSGRDAQTIHRALYKPKEKGRGQLQQLSEALLAAEKQPHPNERAVRDLCAQLMAERKRVRTPSFHVDPDNLVRSAKLVVVDECFMLSAQIIQDLKDNAKRVLFLGDPHQLPPVAGNSPLTNRAPDVHLEQIHRQALENPVLFAATEVRECRKVPTDTRTNEHGTWRYMPRDQAHWPDYQAVEQIIVGTNRTRRKFNNRYRDKLGFGHVIQKDDRLIFLKNDHELEIFNGSTGVLTQIFDGDGEADYEVNVALDDGRQVVAVPVCDGPMRDEHVADGPREVNAIDYAYAITAHKGQGSEYASILVYDEGFGHTAEVYRRWLYTSITRARRDCTFVNARGRR